MTADPLALAERLDELYGPLLAVAHLLPTGSGQTFRQSATALRDLHAKLAQVEKERDEARDKLSEMARNALAADGQAMDLSAEVARLRSASRLAQAALKIDTNPDDARILGDSAVEAWEILQTALTPAGAETVGTEPPRKDSLHTAEGQGVTNGDVS